MDPTSSVSPLNSSSEVRDVVGLFGAEVVHPELSRVLVLQEGGHLLDRVPVEGPFPGRRKAVGNQREATDMVKALLRPKVTPTAMVRL